MNPTVEFIKAALKNPMQISTVFQTSPWLAEALLRKVPLSDAKLVLELGPGAGAVTKPLLEKVSDDCKYVGIELNSHLVQYLHKNYPNRDFLEGSAELATEVAAKYGPIDAVVSSLPWTVFPYELQDRIITNVHESLKEGGVFVTYVCLNASFYPAAKTLKSLLYDKFSSVTKSPTEWRNIPPAFVYTCTK